jgi:hypothetical protein
MVMIRKLNLVTTLAALVLFFLPWIDIQCSGQRLATQTGFQSIYGGGAVPEELEALASSEPTVKKGPDSLGFAPLVGMAFLLVAAGVFFSLRAVLDEWRTDNFHLILPAAALLLLVVQLLIGFPAKKAVLDGMKQMPAERTSAEYDEISDSMAKLAFSGFRFVLTPVFYLELAALGFPALVLANAFLDKHKRREQPVSPRVRDERPEDVYFK